MLVVLLWFDARIASGEVYNWKLGTNHSNSISSVGLSLDQADSSVGKPQRVCPATKLRSPATKAGRSVVSPQRVFGDSHAATQGASHMK